MTIQNGEVPVFKWPVLNYQFLLVTKLQKQLPLFISFCFLNCDISMKPVKKEQQSFFLARRKRGYVPRCFNLKFSVEVEEYTLVIISIDQSYHAVILNLLNGTAH
ncbi:hypothetical protein N008_02845 [Hymenobacter sp. APR13]|nr:hypothetical protein N008_02845 [Hymenobacter sp. APR13]